MKLIGLTLALGIVASAQQSPRPAITGIAHMAIYAHDVPKSLAFYCDFLGYQVPFTLPTKDGHSAVSFVKVNDRQYIEISPEKEPGSDRLNHISIETPDAEAMRVYLRSQRVTVPDAVGKNRIGNSSFSIKDPEGHGVEITQYDPDSWTLREKGKYMSDARVSTRMMHVGIIVAKLEPETKFYEDVLGFKEFWRGSKSATELSWVNLKVPDGQDYVEFMLFKEVPPPAKRGTAHHICLEVPDVNAALATLNARPYRKEYTRPLEVHVGVNRKRIINLFDPDGTRIEVMEPTTIDGKPTPSSTAPPPN
jgi:catechol 2,3-dioxygenase-like lactoylglutathione lyase family enzyme